MSDDAFIEELLTLTRKQKRRNFIDHLATTHKFENIYKECKDSVKSDEAVLSLVCISCFYIKKRANFDFISLKHLRIFLSAINLIDEFHGYVIMSSHKLEIDTSLVLSLIKKLPKKERKECFNKMIKTSTIKTIILRLKNKEYLEYSEIKFTTKTMLSKYFINHYDLKKYKKNKIDNEIFCFIKENIDKASLEEKINIFNKYDNEFNEEIKYNEFKSAYEKVNDLETGKEFKEFAKHFLDKKWQPYWEKLIVDFKEPINQTVNEKTINFNHFFPDDDTISEELLAYYFLQLGYNFDHNSLSIHLIESIENKRDFVIKTLNYEINKKDILNRRSYTDIDTRPSKVIKMIERIMPCKLKMKFIMSFRDQFAFEDPKKSISREIYWNRELMAMFEDYLFEYCNEDLSLDDDYFKILEMKYAT